mmetsp:Transcript_67741/g.147561  ORF Transcript_67741/g.147561 Transcript_67741/m.147561 type:complete len:203 (+) Transcript_67741:65-673(+)
MQSEFACQCSTSSAENSADLCPKIGESIPAARLRMRRPRLPPPAPAAAAAAAATAEARRRRRSVPAAADDAVARLLLLPTTPSGSVVSELESSAGSRRPRRRRPAGGFEALLVLLLLLLLSFSSVAWRRRPSTKVLPAKAALARAPFGLFPVRPSPSAQSSTCQPLSIAAAWLPSRNVLPASAAPARPFGEPPISPRAKDWK